MTKSLPSGSAVSTPTRKAATPKKLSADLISPIKLQELQAENAFLEKEVETYRKESQTDTKRQADQIRSLVTEKEKLLAQVKSLEEKVAFLIKEKINAESEVNLTKNKSKNLEATADKIERDFEKEKKRFGLVETNLNEKVKVLTKEKIEAESLNVVLTRKNKILESQLAKIERETPRTATGSSNNSKETASSKIALLEEKLKAKDNEIKELAEIVETNEEAIEELEKQNTLLHMQVKRLEASHSYAVELENDLEELAILRIKVDELEEKNAKLERMVAAGSQKTVCVIDEELERMTKKIALLAREE